MAAANATNMSKRPVKPHGCLCPFHPQQLVSYGLFAFYAFVFYGIDLVALQQLLVLDVLLTLFYSAILVAIVILALIETFSDPTDPVVYFERALKASG